MDTQWIVDAVPGAHAEFLQIFEHAPELSDAQQRLILPHLPRLAQLFEAKREASASGDLAELKRLIEVEIEWLQNMET